MPKLVAPAEIHVWGFGCETSTCVRLRCEPIGGGGFLSIEAVGDGQTRLENLLLDEIELDALLVALTDTELAGRTVEGDLASEVTHNSAVGQVNLAVPLDTGRVEEMVTRPQRLVALADFLLALVERAGIALLPKYHPFGSR